MLKIEIACFNLESALLAEKVGADRIELCEDYSLGGITPSEVTIIEARKKISIPVYVMIRPRGGNFVYTDKEFELMKAQIIFCREKGMDGVVLGILDKDSRVDKDRCRELVRLAKKIPVTFHRAFDEVDNSFRALGEIIDCGFSRILTSGKQSSAIVGAALISRLIEKSGNRIIIMPGGGVRGNNISELLKTKAKEFHSAAINKTSLQIDEAEIRTMKMMLSK